MIQDLHLAKNELLIYAIIYQHSQGGCGEYSGTMEELGSRIGISRQAAHKAINNLVKKGLIKKKSWLENNIKFCTYQANLEELNKRG